MQREEKEDEKSYFRRIAFTWRDLHNDEDGMGDRSDPRQEEGMTIQDLFASQTKHEKLQEKKAIVRAVIRYFEEKK